MPAVFSRRPSALVLALLLAAACAEEPSLDFEFPPIPEKTVVLTFDDAKKTHRTVVAPLLKELGFGATFFVTPRWMEDTERFLTWEEVAELHAMGFEIGSHSWHHADCSRPEVAMHLRDDLTRLERALAAVGVPKPVSFAWPAGRFGPESIAVLDSNRYLFSRRGLYPGPPLVGMHHGALYDPARHHPHLVPTSVNAVSTWTLDFFVEGVKRAREGTAAVIQFHGIPDLDNDFFSIGEELFRECMGYLKREGYRVIAMRDLARHVDPTVSVDDPLRPTRFP
jgi:peptidoglycan/xylan/chitin deacetylase (PgdA/CDA1 family)